MVYVDEVDAVDGFFVTSPREGTHNIYKSIYIFAQRTYIFTVYNRLHVYIFPSVSTCGFSFPIANPTNS